LLATVKKFDAWDMLNKMMQRGSELTNEAATPQEKYVKRMTELNVLLTNGAISIETWNRQVGMARDELRKSLSPIEQMIKSFEEEIATYGMSSRASQVWREEMEHGSSAATERASRLAKYLDVMDQIKKAQEEHTSKVKSFAEGVKSSVQTPVERAKEELQLLDEAFQQNLVTADEYQRKLAEVGDALSSNAMQHPKALEFGTGEAYTATAATAAPMTSLSNSLAQGLKQDQMRNNILQEIAKALKTAQPLNVKNI
jgi:chromosome segregation ATPase